MHHSAPTLFRSAAPTVNPGEIAWEELPSLAGVLKAQLAARNGTQAVAEVTYSPRQPAAVWDETVPAPLSTAPESAPTPFRETLSGLATRELSEPDVFEHFFGRTRIVRA